TGGSVRIPSAFCGLTGFKPTARRVPTMGAFPLSGSLDSIGPLAASVNCCATVDAVLTGQALVAPAPARTEHPRLAVAGNTVLEGADETVRTAFAKAIQALRRAGAQVEMLELPEFSRLADINRQGGFVCAEAWAIHRELLDRSQAGYDPRVASRIL